MAKRVLWIDDSLDFLEFGHDVLSQLGIECDMASGNGAATRLLNAKSYDLIISDIMRPPDGLAMPDAAGFGRRTGIVFFEEVIRKTHPGTPVLFLTVVRDHEVHRQIQAWENCRILNKPPHLADVREVVSTLLADSREDLYDYCEPSEAISRIVRVDFLTVNEGLLEYLARHPEAVHQLTPRGFEELVARIFDDLGYEVTLTPQRRDGGADIYAIKRDDLGTLLFVVECKKYAPDRPVGVCHVRSLYGVKNMVNASAAILVATSFFTKPAKAFQESRRYELSLKDYDAVKRWLRRYVGPRGLYTRKTR